MYISIYIILCDIMCVSIYYVYVYIYIYYVCVSYPHDIPMLDG